MNRADLHSDAENYDVWCERCQKVHRYYTFTREDLDRVVTDHAKALADEVDRRMALAVFNTVKTMN
jgi:hypothetical protein